MFVALFHDGMKKTLADWVALLYSLKFATFETCVVWGWSDSQWRIQYSTLTQLPRKVSMPLPESGKN